MNSTGRWEDTSWRDGKNFTFEVTIDSVEQTVEGKTTLVSRKLLRLEPV
jgi:hypothetical protein